MDGLLQHQFVIVGSLQGDDHFGATGRCLA
jgi:hypothetical protein